MSIAVIIIKCCCLLILGGADYSLLIAVTIVDYRYHYRWLCGGG